MISKWLFISIQSNIQLNFLLNETFKRQTCNSRPSIQNFGIRSLANDCCSCNFQIVKCSRDQIIQSMRCFTKRIALVSYVNRLLECSIVWLRPISFYLKKTIQNIKIKEKKKRQDTDKTRGDSNPQQIWLCTECPTHCNI